ncbi:hypothetical protein DBA29_00690 [Xenophilus aerolatus]|nr:hypothetical protein [Xenophilus aerolatus]
MMNKSYRTIWNEALGAWVAASELATSEVKRSSSRRALTQVAGLLLIATAPAAWSQSVGGGVASGANSTAVSPTTCATPATAAGSDAIAGGCGASAAASSSIAWGRAAQTVNVGDLALGPLAGNGATAISAKRRAECLPGQRRRCVLLAGWWCRDRAARRPKPRGLQQHDVRLPGRTRWQWQLQRRRWSQRGNRYRGRPQHCARRILLAERAGRPQHSSGLAGGPEFHRHCAR